MTPQELAGIRANAAIDGRRANYDGTWPRQAIGLLNEIDRLRAALVRIASISACDDHPPCGHMALADDIAVQAVTGHEPPDYEPELEPAKAVQ